MRAAVIDLGSNSFRLQLSQLGRDGTISSVHEERRMLHLGGVVALHGHLPEASVRRAIGAARELADLTERVGCDRTFAVATSALREAANGPEVVDELSRAIGIQVKVVDGLEEARLSFLGAGAAVRLPEGERMVLDLGGGSLEVAIGTGPWPDRTTTHLLGVSRLHALIGVPDALDRPTRRRLADLVTAGLAGAPTDHAGPVVAVGGSIRAIAEVVAARRSSWVPPSVNHITMTRDEVVAVTKEMSPLGQHDRVDIMGVRESRAVDLPVAGVILSTAMAHLGTDRVVVSDWGLRTGVLVEGLGLKVPVGEAVWRRSVDALRDRFLPDDPHPEHVEELVGQLWLQLEPLHRLPGEDLRVVTAGALLHDIGRALSFDGHHKHSAYLVEHAGLRGLEPDELAAVLALVVSHRGGPPKRRYPPFASLPSRYRDRVLRMAALLQLADALDRPRDGAVREVVVGDDGGSLIIRLRGVDVSPPRPGAADARIAHAEAVFGRRIEFVVD